MKLKQLQTFLTKLPEFVKHHLINDAAPKILAQIQFTHSAEKDPFGKRWKPTKQPNPILTKTGLLKNSYAQNKLKFSNKTPYAVHHQYGTKHMDQRKILPMDTIPKEWLTILEKSLADFIKNNT